MGCELLDGQTRTQRMSRVSASHAAVGDNGRGRQNSSQRPDSTEMEAAMWMMDRFSDGFEMVVMLSAERDRECDAV